VNEVQKVYRDQGVSIHDKHIELVARQMTGYVQVVSPGPLLLIPGTLLRLPKFQEQYALAELALKRAIPREVIEQMETMHIKFKDATSAMLEVYNSLQSLEEVEEALLKKEAFLVSKVDTLKENLDLLEVAQSEDLKVEIEGQLEKFFADLQSVHELASKSVTVALEVTNEQSELIEKVSVKN
jgi:hypothetical protein